MPGVEAPTLAVFVHECGHHTVCVGVDVRPHEFCVHKCKCASMCVCVCVCVCVRAWTASAYESGKQHV